MHLPTFAEFSAAAQLAGATGVLVREWAPLTVLAEHRHPYAVDALVVAGEMWLTRGETTTHLGAGDRFSLAANEPHSERYGDAGATYWVAMHETDFS